MHKPYLTCRFCNTNLKETFVNLGLSPISNENIKFENLRKKESFYPLTTYVCKNCLLVQTMDVESSDKFFNEDYPYFSSFSESWLKHAADYVDMISKKLGLTTQSKVVELASNDGYLLQYFKKKNIQILGVEPSASVAQAARDKGIETIIDFFSLKTAQTIKKNRGKADLIIANNVIAHVPDINDFVQGIKEILHENGTITLEFHHLMNLIRQNQFDTIYHEHFSYFSLLSIQKIFQHNHLDIYDVEQLQTHGGSLRIYACHQNKINISDRVDKLIAEEKHFGLHSITTYKNFQKKVEQVKRDLLKVLIGLKNENKTIIAYGAAAKGNTLLNSCGIKGNFIDYVVDKNPHKQGLYLPGTRIKIVSPNKIVQTRPDYILILPWNIKAEIIAQLEYTKEWKAKFIIPIPEVEII